MGVTDMSVEDSAGGVKLGGMPADIPSLVLILEASLFNINDIYHCDVIPHSKLSAHATEWGPAEVLLIGPRTC